MNDPSFDLLVCQLLDLKKTDPLLVGEKIRDANPDIRSELAAALGCAIGKTQSGRSFRRINPRKTVVAGSADIIFSDDQTQVLMQERWRTDGMWEPC